MLLSTETAHVSCPSCGEPMELVIDPSQDEQDYVEDCWVCCRPFVAHVRVEGQAVDVWVEQEGG